MKRLLIFMAACFFVEASGLHAETSRGTEQSPYELDDSVAVTANRVATPLNEIASSITVITRAEIEKSQSAFVSHLLRNVPGIDIVQSGGTGKFTSVFIRGSNAHHALVLIDGIPLNDPSSPNNAADLSNLLTVNVERIEILRGSQSVLYGPDAIGGVVQIITTAGKAKPSLSITSEAGSFDSYNLAGNIAGIYKKLGYSVSAERLKTNGVSSADFATERDGYENTHLSTRLDLAINKSFRLNLIGRVIDSESELDKTGGILDDPDFLTSQTEQQYQVVLIRQTPISNWSQRLSVFYVDVERTTFDDFDFSHPSDSESTTTDGQRIGASFQQSIQTGPINKISMGIETEKVAFTSDLFFRSGFGDFADTVDEKHSWSRGIYIFDQFQLFQNAYLTFGGRLDEHKQFGGSGTFRLTAAYLVDKTGTRLRGVIGNGYKAPSVFQLYHPSPYIGNKDLQPEKSQSWEIGFDQELTGENLKLVITYFNSDYEDLIVGIENVAEASSDGLEAGLEARVGKMRSRLDYTYCESEDKTANDVLIRRPKHKLAASSDFNFTSKLLVNLTARMTGERDDLDFSQSPAPRVVLESYSVVNLAASYDITRAITVTSRIDNLFDERYQEVFSYGSVPFSIYAGIRLTN